MGMPPGHTHGVYMWQTTVYTTPPHPATAQEWASGLKRPRGVRAGQGQGRHAALTLLYLRSFWPGHRIGPRPIRGKCWIGSRSSPARAGLDVSDLECLG